MTALFKKLLLPLKLAVGLGLLSYFYFNGGINFAFLFQPENWFAILFLLGLQILISVVSTYRWFLFTKCVGLSATLKDCLLYSWIGQLFSSFLPNFVSADAVRAIYLTRQGESKKKVFLSVVYDRLAATMAVAALAIAAWLTFYYQLHWAFYFISFSITLITAALIAARVTRVNLSRWAASLPLSVITFHLKVFSLLYVAHFFVGVPYARDWFLLSMTGQFFESVPVSPANVGFGHYVFHVLYQFTDSTMGAQVYNIYFTIKLLFKLSGLIPWLAGSFRKT